MLWDNVCFHYSTAGGISTSLLSLCLEVEGTVYEHMSTCPNCHDAVCDDIIAEFPPGTARDDIHCDGYYNMHFTFVHSSQQKAASCVCFK